MSGYEILDPRFASLIIGPAKLEQLWTGGRWTEGPVYVPAGKSFITAQPPLYAIFLNAHQRGW